LTADDIWGNQEVSEMLGGRISNQDEDEVEDELAALEAEVAGEQLPSVPMDRLPALQTEGERTHVEVRRDRTERKAMLVS
jgi:charged multivesicular body protein 6